MSQSFHPDGHHEDKRGDGDRENWFDELNAPDMQIRALEASMECFIEDIKRALEEPIGKRVILFRVLKQQRSAHIFGMQMMSGIFALGAY